MIILFPEMQTLQLALTSGLIPEGVAAAPAEFATDDEGRVWVKSEIEIGPAARTDLKQLGVSFRKSLRGASSDPTAVTCWPQILPLEKVSQANSSQNGPTERTPVLFDLPESANLGEVVSEMLRLGNDRQSFRQQQTPAGVRTLLQVKGPPYYTLLRAIDDLDGARAPRAFIEQSPRVWVQYGYRHPLADRIQPSPGTFLLLSPPSEWTAIEEGKFRDIYEALRFTIPAKPIEWEARELEQRLKVRLRLVRGGSEDPAELWVLSEKGIGQLEDLVRSSDDRLISRLAFAVGTSPEKHDDRVLVVKVRPGKEPPPVLVLDGVACRSYLRIPNLFLPVGHRLHPPLRRDAVKKLLAADANLDTWLLPGADGQFVPQSLPDNAFRPLADWVDYVLDTSRNALTTWMESMQFDFESFVCPDEGPDLSPPARQRPREADKREAGSAPPRRSSKPSAAGAPARETMQGPRKPTAPARRRTAAVLPPSELQLKLETLEEEFRRMPGPLDSPERVPIWRELGELHLALGHKSEGAICHVNGLWEQPAFPEEWIADWFEGETGTEQSSPLAGDEFQSAISAERPTPVQLNLIAVHLIRAAYGRTPALENLRDQLGRIFKQLERFESFLPMKVAWLAWLGYVRLSGNDLLTLARTRDRMLERLHQQGPSPELDLPSFLRSTGPGQGGPVRFVQEAMRNLRERVQNWIQRELSDRSTTGKGQTAAYADLMLAYGLARVGLARECQELLEKTERQLLSKKNANLVHEWLFDAFRFRITQAREGKSRAGSLPEELMKPLVEKTIDSNLVYIIDSLRAKSKILQPYEQVSAQTRFLSSLNHSSLQADVEHLSDIENRVELAARVRELLDEHGGEMPLSNPQEAQPKLPLGSTTAQVPNHHVLLSALLPYSPRLGEAHANELLNEVHPVLEALANPSQQAVLLDKALFVAAHFGQAIYVRQYVEQLHSLFESAGSSETAGVFGILLGQSFRGLRKLGMRDEISSLLDHMDRLIEAGRFESPPESAPKRKKAKSVKSKPEEEQELARKMDAMTLRLNLASGWFYFGNDERAHAILDEVGAFLYQEKSLRHHLRRALVRQYASALEHAPMEVAIPKLEEIFEKLSGITKGFGAGIQDNYYAYELLEIVESVVLALVSDDMTLDPKARRLMEELEFSIRKRIHRDMDQARRDSGV